MHTKLEKARLRLILSHPFYASLALRLPLHETKEPGTAWTDGASVTFSQEALEKWTDAEVLGVYVHELLHVALDHAGRQGNRNHETWNIACDAAINAEVIDAKFALPGNFVPPVRGKTAERIYQENPNPPKPKNYQPDIKPGTGESKPSLLAQAEIQATVIAAAKGAKMQGKPVPASIQRLVDELTAPKGLPWKEILRQFLQSTVRADYDWTRPSRRFVHQGLYLPGLREDAGGEIAVVIDTSGSISPATLASFAAELSAILEDVQATARVIYCDTKVYSGGTYTPDDLPLHLEAQGGGGTDFRPAFEYLDNQENLQAVVFFTDTWGEFPALAPEYPVIFACVDRLGNTLPFGTVIDLDESN